MDGKEARPVGKTKDAGWQIGARRTLPVSYQAAWKFITSPEGVKIWLGDGPNLDLAEGASYELADGTTGEVRVLAANSHLRLTWRPLGWPRPSTIQVRVIPKGEKTVIAFHQEHMPGPEQREARRAFFQAVLDEFETKIGEAFR